MQQAATRAQQVPSSAADGNAAPGVLRNGFVINLISSTTPVALTRPEHAGLRRFTFFVSRRREEGRERFRLHMGYFDSQEEAEKLLDIVREIYPGAWAGLAPGRGLRGTPPVAQPPDAAPPASVENRREDAAVHPARPVRAERTNAPAMARGAAAVIDRRDRVDVTQRHSAAQSLGSVRATIDALEDSAGAAAPAAAMEKPRVVPTLRAAGAVPTLKPAITPAPAARAPEATPSKRASAAAATAAVSSARQPQAARPPESAQAMKEREVLKLLESSARAARKAAAAAAVEKPSFAVQLAWSVEPIDLTRVPQLAIFSAYTLYGAQGHREGRRWYGLRLGFFTDAVSAKQVAQYVRADFATVSVVPVSSRERDQATRAIAGASVANPATVEPVPGAARPARSTPAASRGSLDEFKFIDDAADVAPVQSGDARGDARGGAAPAIPRRPSRGAPGKRAVFRAGRVHARSKVKNMTLEQTLEILGANDLAVETPEKRVANGDEAVAPVAPAPSKPSKLSRLFERLSERLGT